MSFINIKVYFIKIFPMKYVFNLPKKHAKLIKRYGICKFYARIYARIIRCDTFF